MDTEFLNQLDNKKKLSDKDLFKGFKFFLSREVNIELFEFLIKSFGGECYYHSENFNSEFYQKNEFTHVIVDRVVKDSDKKVNTEFVQPQWICDSLNFNKVLPIKDYVPGQTLPPHLSPFVDSKELGYMTSREKEIKRLKGEFVEESVDDSEEEVESVEKGEYTVKENRYDHKEELAKQEGEKIKKSKEQDLLSSMTLNKKKKRLYERILKCDDEKKNKVKALVDRRKQIKKK